MKRITAMIMVIMLILISVWPKTITYAREETLKDKIAEATVLLEEEIKGQYENVLSEIKETITEKGYDYPMTMKSFLDEGNPFRNMDYLGVMAAVTSVNQVLKKSGKDSLNVTELQFVSWEMEEDTYTDYEAVKVSEYIERGDGTYEKSGYHFTTKKETVGKYREIESSGYYEKTGETTITPKEVEKKYAVISLKITELKDIVKVAGLDPETLEEGIAQRKDILSRTISNEMLRSNVFLTIPAQAGGNNVWLKKFIKAIGYEDTSKIEITGQTIANIASTLIGMIPYEWGGKAKHSGYDNTWWLYDEESGLQNGLDCSGFVQWVYMTAGFDQSITSKLISTNSILNAGFMEVSENELMPGDIGVVEHKTSNHCGIYKGDGTWYHCSSYNNTVVDAAYNFTTFYRIISDEEAVERSINIQYTDLVDSVEKADEHITAAEQEVSTVDTQSDMSYVFDQEDDFSYTEEDVYLTAQLISHEANNQGLNGWIAVGEVVKNRLKADAFPSSIKDVIFQEGQFTDSSEINDITPRQEIIEVARSVLQGTLSILHNENVLFFRNAGGSTQDWGEYKYFITIGDHQFYLGKES